MLTSPAVPAAKKHAVLEQLLNSAGDVTVEVKRLLLMLADRDPLASLADVADAFTARVMIDGNYVKAYADEKRVVNAPNVDFTRGESIMFYCDGNDENPVFITNIRLAAGGRKLYAQIQGITAPNGVVCGGDRSPKLRP